MESDADICGVKIGWKKPENGGSTIQKYKIEVLGEEGFQVLEGCGEKGETECTTSMDMLSKEPYNLKVGD